MARRQKITIAGNSDNPQENMPLIIADGDYPAANGSMQVGVDYSGGHATWFISGTFGGGTAKLQILSPDGTTWHNLVTAATVTADAAINFFAPAGKMRVNITGSTDPSLQSWIVGIPTNNGG